LNALGATSPIPNEHGVCDARLFVDCTLRRAFNTA
jgi:hypothetical protein